MSSIMQPTQPIKKEEVSPIEILNKLRGWLKKYGYTFDDSNLVGVIENIKLKKVHVGLSNDKFHLDMMGLDNTINPEASSQRILVFPRGKFFIQKYDKWLTFDDTFYNEIAESFESEALTRPYLDKNHELKESFGNILNYEVTPDGMYFEIQLNDNGKDLIASQNYMYISPTFGAIIDTQGEEHENVLVSISLTNVPALMSNIPALQEQLELENSTRKKENKKMNLKELTQKLELQDEASVSAIAEAVQAMMNEGADKDTLIAELQKALASLQEEMAEKTKAVDEVNAALSKIKQEELQKEADSTIDLAIKTGQYHPALKELKMKQFITDKESVLKELEVIPTISGDQVTSNTPSNNKFTDEDKQIALSAGYDLDKPEDKIKFEKMRGE